MAEARVTAQRVGGELTQKIQQLRQETQALNRELGQLDPQSTRASALRQQLQTLRQESEVMARQNQAPPISGPGTMGLDASGYQRRLAELNRDMERARREVEVSSGAAGDDRRRFVEQVLTKDPRYQQAVAQRDQLVQGATRRGFRVDPEAGTVQAPERGPERMAAAYTKEGEAVARAAIQHRLYGQTNRDLVRQWRENEQALHAQDNALTRVQNRLKVLDEYEREGISISDREAVHARMLRAEVPDRDWGVRAARLEREALTAEIERRGGRFEGGQVLLPEGGGGFRRGVGAFMAGA
ncbi:MAG: hypothetical protein HY699_01730, partial [Deltaproteobacteria bacterium]|nr:hypothetical protein [Deltaproteobacteria bacterium]